MLNLSKWSIITRCMKTRIKKIELKDYVTEHKGEEKRLKRNVTVSYAKCEHREYDFIRPSD